MNETIREPARETEIYGDFDVVVVGGGIAGVAAAVRAAREGATVCLLEKQIALGGLATLGNVAIYLPLCDGFGRQVIGGIAEELLHLSVADRPDAIPERFRDAGAAAEATHSAAQQSGGSKSTTVDRYMATFNPATLILALDDFVTEAGVRVIFDVRVCGAAVEDGRIAAVFAEGKAGRFAVRAKAFIDATGDADLANFAGEPTTVRDTNVATAWFYAFRSDTGMRLVQGSRPYDRHGTPISGSEPFFSGCTPDEITSFAMESRRMIRERLREGETAYQFPTIPGFRMTRRIDGCHLLTEADAEQWPEDTVASFGSWREASPAYPLPISSLKARTIANLWAAGRCIAADGLVWDLIRAIPVCALSGEVSALLATGDANAADVRRRVEAGGGIPAEPRRTQ